jgi:tetratricopeptide (TPR) repeat protein
MRTTRIVLLTAACGLLAWPLRADKKLDDAVAKAEEQIQKGRVDDAAKTIQRMLQPPTAEGHVAATRLQVRMGKIEEAFATATAGVQAGTTPEGKAAALAALSGVDLLRGPGKDALKHAQEAVAAQASPAALAALARAQVRVGDAAGAVASAEKAVAAGATADTLEAQGQALLASGKAAEAQAAFAKAAAADPRSSAAHVGAARALLAQSKAAEAVAEARKAVEVNTNDGEAHAVLGLALLAQNPAAWGDAIASAQEGRYKNERNVMVLYAVAKIFDDPKSNNQGQAEGVYRAAAAIDPDFGPVKFASLSAMERAGKNAEAYTAAKQLAEANPNNAELQLILGRLALRNGDFLAAVAPLEGAAKVNPNNAEVQAMYGTALFNARQQAEALAAYEKAVKLAPTNVDYKTTYGLLLGMADKFAEAIKVLEEVISSPGYKNPAGYTNLGWVYRNANPPQAEKAVAAYGKALELDAKNGQAALGLGWASSYARKYDEAIAAFTKAASLDTKLQGEALNGIAWAQYFKKDMASAKATAAKAKELGRNVTELLSTIDKFEKGLVDQAEAERKFKEQQRESGGAGGGGGGGGIDGAASRIMRGGAAERRAAAVELAKFGGEAVQYLIYAVANDKDFGVRGAAAQSLGNIGGAAKSACAQLRSMANNNPYEKTIMTPEEQQLFVRYADFQKILRAAVAKIGC